MSKLLLALMVIAPLQGAFAASDYVWKCEATNRGHDFYYGTGISRKSEDEAKYRAVDDAMKKCEALTRQQELPCLIKSCRRSAH